MKSRRSPKAIFVGGAILALLVLMSLGLALPQAKTAGRPPEPVWGIRLPDLAHASGLNAYGKYPTTNDNTDVYWHDGINVQAGVTRDSRGHCDIIYFIVDRTDDNNWAALRGIVIDPVYTAPGPVTCGFPPPFDLGGVPYCIQNFLNQPHPFEGYDHIQFRTYLFTFLEDIAPEMGKFPLSNGDWGNIFLWTKSECDAPQIPGPYSDYHRVIAKFKTSDDSVDGGSLSIQRIDTNTWRIFVEHQKFSVEEQYCVPKLVTGKNGRTYYSGTTYTPFEGCAYPVSYTYDLVKK